MGIGAPAILGRRVLYLRRQCRQFFERVHLPDAAGPELGAAPVPLSFLQGFGVLIVPHLSSNIS